MTPKLLTLLSQVKSVEQVLDLFLDYCRVPADAYQFVAAFGQFAGYPREQIQTAAYERGPQAHKVVSSLFAGKTPSPYDYLSREELVVLLQTLGSTGSDLVAPILAARRDHVSK